MRHEITVKLYEMCEEKKYGSGIPRQISSKPLEIGY